MKGFEPSAAGATTQCSIQLSYTHHKKIDRFEDRELRSLEDHSAFGVTRGSLRLRQRADELLFAFASKLKGTKFPLLKRTSFAVLQAALPPILFFTFLGAPGGTRTPGPQLRRLLLYPVELQAPRRIFSILSGRCQQKGPSLLKRRQFALLESALDGRSPVSSFFLPRMLQKNLFKKLCPIDEMIT